MRVPCRIIIVDGEEQLADWRCALDHALAAPLAPAVLAEFGVTARTASLQLVADSARLRAALSSLTRQPGWRVRLGLHQEHQLLAILEARPGAAAGAAAIAALVGSAAIPILGVAPIDLSGPAFKTVVLVEDDAIVRAVCRRILQDRCLVLEAGAAADALALGAWLPWQADLLVSDVNLPRMDGIALAERWLKRWRLSRVLLLSGSFVPDGAAALPAVFLQKPFQAHELVHCVGSLVGDSSWSDACTSTRA
jgi:CheY-like chemotaxis protein